VPLPEPGHVFERKYRIIRLIGSGGFAQVYRAEFEDVGRQVAIKILAPDPELGAALYPTDIDQRFLREAQMLSELRDPHTVIMHDFGRAESGLLYMVFEFIDGKALNQLIKQNGPQPALLVRRILEQVLLSLREAHSKGILHRDIKPANIMLYEYMGDASHVKLLDFGIAKPLGADPEQDVTKAGTMMGTPRYMSPEQICGQKMSPAADIYSLGLVAYELLVGRPAIEATTSPTIVRIQLGPDRFELPPMPHCPPELKRIIDRMTQKELPRRYQTVDQVLQDLRSLGRVDPSHAVQALGSAQGGPDPTQPMTQPPESFEENRGPHAAAPGHFQNTGQPRIGMSGQTPTSGSISNQTPQGTPNSTQSGLASRFSNPSNPSVPMVPVQRPQNTTIEIEKTPQKIHVELPIQLTQTALILLGGATVLFFLTISMGIWMLILPAAAAGIFAIGFALKTAELEIDASQDQWVMTRRFLTFETTKNGPVRDIVCMREENRDGKSVLNLVTENRAYEFATGLKPGENAWIVGEVTNFVNRLRS